MNPNCAMVNAAKMKLSIIVRICENIVAVMISILGRDGQVSTTTSNLFHKFYKDGFIGIVVYVYTSLITTCASNERYREAILIFKKMEEEGCKPTLITYNVILNVYWEIGMPGKKITTIFDGMKSSGVALDAYTYNTLISSCRQWSLYEEAKQIFEEMKVCLDAFNALIKMHGNRGNFNEMVKVLEEIKLSSCSPNIVTPDLSTYNTYLAALARGERNLELIQMKLHTTHSWPAMQLMRCSWKLLMWFNR
ncbi:hypothetical protein POM88_031383 [Heracleum sosnowskyi]|uniref:Pentatricopeptide repeat-containing protein n=1 Tax=Heracleum sosnowskyi TaxID=360622 RepID=A0AAD8I087_9APIA|nr:hypothetical protein POM88_031383 [Heracleum sosnowskyi]